MCKFDPNCLEVVIAMGSKSKCGLSEKGRSVYCTLCCIFVHVSELSLLVINSQRSGDIINSFNQPQFGGIKV